MGLFGYVLNGTVKNPTVDNFSCDGEFTPTGVIAAYAVNSTFENIAVTNCNPGVYNTGNGGIVGIGGNSDDEKFFKNHRPKRAMSLAKKYDRDMGTARCVF